MQIVFFRKLCRRLHTLSFIRGSVVTALVLFWLIVPVAASSGGTPSNGTSSTGTSSTGTSSTGTSSSAAASADTGGMVYVKGSVWLNGSGIPGDSAVLPGDLVQTNGDSFANIKSTNLNLMVAPDSLLRFESGRLDLKRGAIAVDTGNAFTIHAAIVTIVPASKEWTRFEVRETEDEVRILAGEGKLNVTDSNGTVTVMPGEQTIYAIERKKKGIVEPGDHATLDSPWAKIGGSAAGGIVLIWLLHHGNNPVSPSTPNNQPMQ